VGGTEEIIGNWIAGGGRRDDWVIATKVAGAGGQARGGEPIGPDAIRRAVEASLARLRCERIDLYQLHWPNREVYHFRKHWRFDPSGESRAAVEDHIGACLRTLASLVGEGKIAHWGLSNETAWGTAAWLRLADAAGAPRPLSVQNEYSLLCRLYDTDMAELSHLEGVPLLAFSPLGAGLLTGKYAGDVIPEGSRRENNPQLGGRVTPRVWEAVAAYIRVARDAGLDPAQMAVAWTLTRPFPVIPIIGATRDWQLENVLKAADLTLAPDVLAAIDAAYAGHPLPY